MVAKNFKASNIYQNPGIKNNPGVITKPSIEGIAPPAKDKGHGGAEGHSHERLVQENIQHKKPPKVSSEYPVITPKDSSSIKNTISQNKVLDADEFKKGKANPNKITHHTNMFVYSDAPRNASGIGDGDTSSVKGVSAAINSYTNYQKNKKNLRTKLKDFKIKYGEEAVQGIENLNLVGPKPKPKSSSNVEFLAPPKNS